MVSKKNLEWVAAHRKIARAAASARGAGVSEKDIFKSFQRQLAKPPSYRDLRAAFDHYSAQHLKIGPKVGSAIVGPSGKREARKSTYRDLLKNVFAPERKAKLARNYTMNALLVQYADDKKALTDQLSESLRYGYIDWEESQTYGRSPPV